MSTQTILHTIPPLPAGWEGTPNDLLDYIVSQMVSTFEADIPDGVVGGTVPPSDQGIHYGEDAISIFRDGAYHPITDVPIGAVLPWASLSPTPPANYLMCDGSLKLITEYPELAALLGSSWALTTDTDGTRFRLPSLQDRMIMAPGVADFSLNAHPSNAIGAGNVPWAGPVVGKSPVRSVGSLLGYTVPMKVSPWADAPLYTNVTGNAGYNSGFASNETAKQDVTPPLVVMNFIIRSF